MLIYKKTLPQDQQIGSTKTKVDQYDMTWICNPAQVNSPKCLTDISLSLAPHLRCCLMLDLLLASWRQWQQEKSRRPAKAAAPTNSFPASAAAPTNSFPAKLCRYHQVVQFCRVDKSRYILAGAGTRSQFKKVWLRLRRKRK